MLLRRKQPTKFTGPQDLVGFGEVERHDITFMASLEP